MLKFCKTITPLNPALVYKKPRIHPKIPKPNGPHPLGLFFYSLQILLDPIHRSDPMHGLWNPFQFDCSWKNGSK
jgi:hypothetical protein